MTIKEFLKNKILKFLGLEKLADNPNDQRYTFINDDEALKIEEIKANRVWYIGDGNELLNFYTGQQLKGFLTIRFIIEISVITFGVYRRLSVL